MPAWKLAQGKTWCGKLREKHPNHGKIVPVPPGMQKRYGAGTMLIPKPRDVETAMHRVKKGRLTAPSRIRNALAKAAQADHACPFVTGMFIRIVAEAAEEDRRAGKKRITPYWRTVKDDGRFNEKFPGGARVQAVRLREEGFTIQPGKGEQPPRVRDVEKHLVSC